MNIQMVQWYDDEAIGEMLIGPDRYQYVPVPAAEQRPDETAKVLIQRVSDNGRKMGDCYWVASYFDGRCSCTCPDWLYRKAKTWADCRHTLACKEYGLVREKEAESVGASPPW